MKEKNKSLFLFVFICCAILSLIVFSFFLFNNLIFKKNNIISNTKALEEIEKKITNAKENKKNFYDLEKEKKELDKIIVVNQRNLAMFIEYLESLASISSVRASFESIQEAQDKNYSFILNVKMEGNFSDIYRFINLLENIPYFISMDNLILEKKSPEAKEIKNAQNKWEAKINLKILNFDKIAIK